MKPTVTPTKTINVRENKHTTPSLAYEDDVQQSETNTRRRLEFNDQGCNHDENRARQRRRVASNHYHNNDDMYDRINDKPVATSLLISPQQIPHTICVVDNRQFPTALSTIHNSSQHHYDVFSAETQTFPISQEYSQYEMEETVAHDENHATHSLYCLRDVASGRVIPLQSKNEALLSDSSHVYTIGRNREKHVVCTNSMISRNHAEIIHDIQDDSIRLRAIENHCRVLNITTNKWDIVEAGTDRILQIDDQFRLLPYIRAMQIQQQDNDNVQFVLEAIHRRRDTIQHQLLVGTAAMDRSYIDLLRAIMRDGQPQSNAKGANTTLHEPYTLRINLAPLPCTANSVNNGTNGTKNSNNTNSHPANTLMNDSDNILPILTLRKLYPVSAILECIWYLRGEDDIGFLQRNNQTFWDKQAKDGWVGYNYGLLTNYNGTNQLEINVLGPLISGRNSRNMVCTLVHPNERTVQQSCTTSVQFAVSSDQQNHGIERLDLTVTQRSSDVILGLPNDIIVWSILLHLVRREVYNRSNHHRILYPGYINFIISAGGAHVYNINRHIVNELLSREPIPNVQPYLIIDEQAIAASKQKLQQQEVDGNIDNTTKTGTQFVGIFELAQTYDKIQNQKLRIGGYQNGKFHPRIVIEQAL